MIAGTDGTGAFIRKEYRPACGSPFGVAAAGTPRLFSDCDAAPKRPVNKSYDLRTLKIHDHAAVAVGGPREWLPG